MTTTMTKGGTALKIILLVVILVRVLFLLAERRSIVPTMLMQIDNLTDERAVHRDTFNHPFIQNSQQETDALALPSSTLQLLPTKQDEQFWKDEKCFYVEDLCHLSHRFFYKKPTGNETKHQPPFAIDNLQTLPQGYPRHTPVLPDIPLDDVQCTTSPITYHIILTSVFNQMLVEFINRIFIGAYLMLESHPSLLTSSLDQVQLYLLMSERGTIFDGHRLFLGILPTSNPLLDYRRLLDAPRCQCLPRVVFCGYQIEEKKENDTKSYLLHVQRDYDVGRDAGFAKRKASGVYIKMRKRILEDLNSANPFLAEMISDFRAAHLKRLHKLEVRREDELEQWRFVGLCQRNSRRKWTNLRDVLNQCNRQFKAQKIVCIETNVDKEDGHTIQQAVMHGALHALIGVHGSQLGNALLLSPGAHVVEVMSWFPDFMFYGRSWARRTDMPTPIGVLFQDTDINHFGYMLERESSPQLCAEYMGKDMEADNECLQEVAKKDRNSIWWGTRDFVINSAIVTKFIEKFMVDEPRTCRDFEERQSPFQVDGKDKKFAMYNVQCLETPESNMTTPHHYYTDESVVEDKEIAARQKAREEKKKKDEAKEKQ